MIHVFVDYENMKRIDPAVFVLEGATFTLLLGPQNRTLAVGLVEQLMANAAAVELVRLEKAGRNAVDFALAYYLGRKVITDPTAQYYLISKDTGYDPLIEHLRGRNVRVRRIEEFESLPAKGESVKATAKAAAAASAQASAKVMVPIDLIPRILAHLRKHPNNRPRRQQTLKRQLAAQFLKGATDEEIERLVAALVESGHLEIDAKGSITYRLDGGAG